MAKELVDLRPDAIFCMLTLAASGLAPETRTIPIVFAVVGDPIGSGLVTSYARPGRNITGFASFDPAINDVSVEREFSVPRWRCWPPQPGGPCSLVKRREFVRAWAHQGLVSSCMCLLNTATIPSKSFVSDSARKEVVNMPRRCHVAHGQQSRPSVKLYLPCSFYRSATRVGGLSHLAQMEGAAA